MPDEDNPLPTPSGPPAPEQGRDFLEELRRQAAAAAANAPRTVTTLNAATVPAYPPQTVYPGPPRAHGFFGQAIWPNIRQELFGSPDSRFRWGLYDWAGLARPSWMLPRSGEIPTIPQTYGVSMLGLGSQFNPYPFPRGTGTSWSPISPMRIDPERLLASKEQMPIAPPTMRPVGPGQMQLGLHAPSADQFKAMFEAALAKGDQDAANNIIRNAFQLERGFVPSNPAYYPVDIVFQKMTGELEWMLRGGKRVPAGTPTALTAVPPPPTQMAIPPGSALEEAAGTKLTGSLPRFDPRQLRSKTAPEWDRWTDPLTRKYIPPTDPRRQPTLFGGMPKPPPRQAYEVRPGEGPPPRPRLYRGNWTEREWQSGKTREQINREIDAEIERKYGPGPGTKPPVKAQEVRPALPQPSATPPLNPTYPNFALPSYTP